MNLNKILYRSVLMLTYFLAPELPSLANFAFLRNSK